MKTPSVRNRDNRPLGIIFLLCGLALSAFVFQPKLFGVHDDSGLLLLLNLVLVLPVVLTLLFLGIQLLTKSANADSHAVPRTVILLIALILILTPAWVRWTPWSDFGWVLAVIGVAAGIPLLIAGIRQK